MMNKITKILLFLLFATLMSYGQNLMWKVAGKMPIPVFGGEAFAKDSLIYILGGYSDSLRRKVEFIQEFNPSTNQWRIAGNMKLRRQGFFAGVNNDSLFIVGGVLGATAFRRSMEVWNFTGQTVYSTADDNFDRIYPSGEIFENKLYLLGGNQNHKSVLTNVDYLAEYDLFTKHITYHTDGPFTLVMPPAQQMTVIKDSSIYIFGGIYVGISQDIYKFDIKSRKFTKLSLKMPNGRAGGAAFDIGNGKLIVFGGFNEANISLDNSEIYTIAGSSLTFQAGPALNYARREFMTVRYKNSVYVFGGTSNNNNNIAFIERLDLVTDVHEDNGLVPEGILLEQNYPNPFNPKTIISYQISGGEQVSLKVYDLLGNEISELVNEFQWGGKYSVEFDASKFSTGIYFYKLTSGSKSTIKKMVLAK